jgi:hypothetical protein
MSTLIHDTGALFQNYLDDLKNSINPPDSVETGAVRAAGIDPATGKPMFASVANALNASGVNTDDPNAMAKYIGSLQDSATAFFDQQYTGNFQDMGGVSLLPGAPADGGDAALIQSIFGGGSGSPKPPGGLSTGIILAIVIFVFVLLVVK